LAFTRVAAKEAKTRAIDLFPGLKERQFRFFRTIHSLAFSASQERKVTIMGQTEWREFGELAGYEFTLKFDSQIERLELSSSLSAGDKYLQIFSLSVARKTSLEIEYQRSGAVDLSLDHVRRFARQLFNFKKARNLIDFTDLLDNESARRPIDADLIIIDEAQDLTPQQWSYVRAISSEAKKVVLAGDDDQAIYEWSGADPLGLLKFKGTVEVLPKSHRLPGKLFNISNSIVQGIKVRQPKVWHGREEEGSLKTISELEQLDLSEGSWLLLARHRYQLYSLAKEAHRQGVAYRIDGRWSTQGDTVQAAVAYERLRKGEGVTLDQAKLISSFSGVKTPKAGKVLYSWEDFVDLPADRPTWLSGLKLLPVEDREYIRDLRRRKEPLSKNGRVIISTVHGAKGTEADNVVLITDIGKNCQQNSDSERRVAYVAASRARQSLFCLAPRTSSSWAFF
jgi:superfamily I DNA/RNA helicase